MADKEQGAGVLCYGVGENVNVKKGVQQWVKSPPLQSPQEPPDVGQGAGVLRNGEGEYVQQYDSVSMVLDEKKNIQCDQKEMQDGILKNGDNCYHCSRVRRKVNGSQVEKMRKVQYDSHQNVNF